MKEPNKTVYQDIHYSQSNLSILTCLILIVYLYVATLFLPRQISAHPGNTAADGCHYCRTNCDRWGVPWDARHCHSGNSSSTKNPSGLTDTQEKDILNYLNSPEGRSKGDQMMKELLNPTPAPKLTTANSRKTQDLPIGENSIYKILALGGLGYGGYQWLKNRKPR